MALVVAEVLAYAKLNLSLRVRGRRADGYHEIDSLVQTVDLADRLKIRVAQGDALHVTNDLPGLQGPDLAARAAAALLTAKGVRRHVEIQVTKHIPAGAGLGGGSSDAAAVLRFLDRSVPPALPRRLLDEVAAQLGSDVPLFLAGGSLRVRGRGELVEACASPPGSVFAILVPPVHCATPAVYAAWRTRPESATAPCALGTNDLLAPALATYPDLVPYDQAIRRVAGDYAGMSGSGASFYAAFDGPEQAERAIEELRDAFPEARTFLCRPTPSGSRWLEEGGEIR